MTEIKRYVPANDDRGEGTVVRNDQSGTVVFYDDHAAIVAALQEQVRALAAECKAVYAHALEEGYQFYPGGIEYTDAAIREIRAQGAIDARNALVVAGDGADIYAVVSNVAARIRAGEQP